jgi:uncharacterized protein YegP (UPF0339 family)
MAGKYVLKKANNGQFFWNLTAANGQTILTSEMYTSKPAAENGIASARVNSLINEHYERKTNRAGEPMFNLKAANHQVIGTSEGYSSEAAREAGIASVKVNGPTATVDDRTG